MNSRDFIRQLVVLLVLCMLVIGIGMTARSGDQVPVASVPNRGQFTMWLSSLENTDGITAGLYPYFRSEEEDFPDSDDDFLSPMVSAKCILFWLEEQDVDRAVRIGERLLYWQDRTYMQVHVNAAGALPSQIVWRDGRWVSGDRFYSGDNLLILEALLTLYERTLRTEFVVGAERIARWLKDVMGRGEQAGVWLEPYFAPMHFVTAEGSFDNRIFTNTAFLWIRALRHYGEVVGDLDFVEHYVLAKAFFLQGQSPQGVWFDHYDPGYPPTRYSVSRWHWYDEGGVVVADNAMRAGLGALRVGAVEQAERFADWLRPDNGAVYAYLDASTGKSRFVPSDDPYYDVVVSGLWRHLAVGLGREKAVITAERFLARAQSEDGGWYWGRQKRRLKPVQKSAAVLTGFWAVNHLNH